MTDQELDKKIQQELDSNMELAKLFYANLADCARKAADALMQLATKSRY